MIGPQFVFLSNSLHASDEIPLTLDLSFDLKDNETITVYNMRMNLPGYTIKHIDTR